MTISYNISNFTQALIEFGKHSKYSMDSCNCIYSKKMVRADRKHGLENVIFQSSL